MAGKAGGVVVRKMTAYPDHKCVMGSLTVMEVKMKNQALVLTGNVNMVYGVKRVTSALTFHTR
jgi:hypothetical protein